MADKIRFLLFFLFALCGCCLQSFAEMKDLKQQTVTIDFLQDEISYEELLAKIPCPFTVHSVDYHSDVHIDSHEFMYLLALQSGTFVSSDTLIKACSLLAKKNKFSSIDIIMNEDEQGQKHLFFECRGMWTFRALKLGGMLHGIENYRYYYLLEPGEVFNYTKHKHSLKNFKDAFRAEGFLQGTVIDYFEFDAKTKTVTTVLTFDKGQRFIIDAVDFSLHQDDQADAKKILLLKKRIDERFRFLLQGVYYSQELINQKTSSIHKYLTKKGFLNAKIILKQRVRYEAAKVDLEFDIHLPQKKNFVFFGNHFYSNQQLLDTILAFGRSAELLPESLISEEIVRMYGKKGFRFVEVDVKHERQRKFFLIKEGSRVVLKNVILQGSTMDVSCKNTFFKHCIKARYLDEDLMQQACYDLISWYHKEGFWDAEITKQDYNFYDNNAVNVYLTIKEGKRRFLRSMKLAHDVVIDNKVLLDTFEHMPALMPFDVRTLQEQRQVLQKYYHKQGMLHAQIKPELSDDTDAVDVLWTVTGNQRTVKFGKVIVQGSTMFPFENVKRELAFSQGDVWSQEKLEKSLQNLRRLGIFEKIHLYPYNFLDENNEQDVVLKLVEDDPFEIRTRVGFQQVSRNLTFRSGSTYKLGGSVLYRNPFNAADSIIIDTDFTRFYRNVSLVYQRPWLFSQPITTVVKGYSNKYIQPVFIGSDKPLYQAIQQGFLLGLSRSWLHCDLGLQGGLEVMETNHLSVRLARAINFEPALIDKKIPYLYTEPSVVIDYLDNQVNPTRGSLTAISCKAMVPTNKKVPYFVKIVCEQSVFFPILPLVLGFRLRFGHIFNQEFSTIMPPERFYLGGQNSIRSYEANQGPPLGLYFSKKGKPKLVPQGGKSMINANAECRFPLFWQLGGVFFQDAGMLVEKSLTQVLAGHLLLATGFGLRYYTPVGPLRFDIGWKWRKCVPEESSFAWFLTLGHPF